MSDVVTDPLDAAERARLEGARRAVEDRVAAARAALLDVESETLELDVGLAVLDLRSSGFPESHATSVARRRELLASTGHRVLDVLVLPAPSTTRDPGPRLRVEFRLPGSRVGVVLAHVESSRATVFAGAGWGVTTDTEEELRRELSRTGPDPHGAERVGRDHASNDHVRRVLATPKPVRERALRVALDRLRELDAGVDRYGARRSRVGSLLALDEGRAIATHAEAEAALSLVADLAAGAPEEWALTRFTGSVT